MRRRRDRLLKRKSRLLASLTKLGFFPDDKARRRELVQLDPYALRKTGLYEPLAGPEVEIAVRLGYVDGPNEIEVDRQGRIVGTLVKLARPGE